MKKHHVIAAGHICLDITPVFPWDRQVSDIGDLLVPGKLIEMGDVSVHTGGSVANTGLALKIMGNDVRLLGKVGDDAFGAMVRDMLQKHGAGGLIVDKESSTSYSVVLAIPGMDRIFLHNAGANNTFSAADIPEDALTDAALFHFGYPPLMKKMYAEDGKELKQMFQRMKEKGMVTSLDMAAIDPSRDAGKQDWKKILENVLPYVDFFVPSFEELLFMLDRPLYEEKAKGGDMTEGLDTEKYAMPLAEQCVQMGCGAALIKCGLSGLVYATGTEERIKEMGERGRIHTPSWTEKKGRQPCYQAQKVVSGTGAGDVSIAAYLTAVLDGESPEMCAALAAAQGAASVTSYDALGGLLPMEELKKRIHAGWQTMEE